MLGTLRDDNMESPDKRPRKEKAELSVEPTMSINKVDSVAMKAPKEPKASKEPGVGSSAAPQAGPSAAPVARDEVSRSILCYFLSFIV